ncbi:hypothetical protein HanRHA438_Chr16g0764321 [Helianthus annuus]|nr:hypothetical protein HanHA300_Chr16g0613701 [Helianthus annuus]KAJ0443156.1 hypothetical protein HanIR_Chr16g0817641 [Helianthus annuus]KAJ0460736.1 hypothetical protein HanHA89_Chr16g0664301 [Helianthus annuus]KAJ0641144.1 hypothetical protein HanLR1_Chr16g0623891 [Helianthus annuus]KAJ0836207.1 hypothetical protein HanRHA438_Chr16g0764321 [Helianthus annuus]
MPLLFIYLFYVPKNKKDNFTPNYTHPNPQVNAGKVHHNLPVLDPAPVQVPSWDHSLQHPTTPTDNSNTLLCKAHK